MVPVGIWCSPASGARRHLVPVGVAALAFSGMRRFARLYGENALGVKRHIVTLEFFIATAQGVAFPLAVVVLLGAIGPKAFRGAVAFMAIVYLLLGTPLYDDWRLASIGMLRRPRRNPRVAGAVSERFPNRAPFEEFMEGKLFAELLWSQLTPIVQPWRLAAWTFLSLRGRRS